VIPVATNILVMTATITPPVDAPGMVRLDPVIRMEDYKTALSFYLHHIGSSIHHIIFVENSGSDVSALRALVKDHGKEAWVVFYVYDGLDYPPVYGRCYGELRLLDEIMSTSIVAAWPSDTMFWKVTGRYKVINLHTMIRSCPVNIDFYCDVRTARQRPWLDMRFMAWTRLGYETVLRGVFEGVREDENQSRPGEETAFYLIKPRLADTQSCSTWTREPRIDGVRAYDGKNWSRGRQFAVYWLRSFQRYALGRVLL
jgi:hypothetical protein